jgi:hypothetical protein
MTENFLPNAYAVTKSLLCCQTDTLTVTQMQCRFSAVRVQIKLQGVRNVT